MLLKIGTGIFIAGMLGLLLTLLATWYVRGQEVDPVSDQQKIARTLEIIRTSSPTDRKVLKVLFYGQSITRSGWHNAVVAHWRQKYPNTVFVVENRALGGFAAQNLVRTTEQDIAAFYPDLIIFHVYGDHHSYERILRMFRSETAADVILQTDHGEVLPDPPCAEGMRITFNLQPGCTGILWVHQKEWHDEMSYHKIPAFGKKYGMAVEPQRLWWRDYLVRTHTDPHSMLLDEIHPNDRGKELIAGFFNRYFDDLVDHWNQQTEHSVLSIPLMAARRSDGQANVTFEGTRVELISTKPLTSGPSVSVDGTSPKDMDGCYQVTRSSSVGSVPDWPAVSRISLHHDHTPEVWTAIVTGISPDEKSFDFTVKASENKDEGRGSARQTYISTSRQLSIDPQDWMFERAYDLKHIPLQTPFEVHWSVDYVCGNPEVIDHGDGRTEYRYLLGTGLPNGIHELTLSLVANNFANAVEFRTYRPPLHDN